MIPKRRKNWKKVQPRSLQHAMELCMEYAKEKKNLGPERIADLMGLTNHWGLYKYIENGRMPSILIRPFEYACGINFMTRYLAHSNNCLLIPMPTGKRVTHVELAELSTALADINRTLHLYYSGDREAPDVCDCIVTIMEDLAFHKANIEKEQQPELDFNDE